MVLAILVTTAAVAQQKVVIISSSPRHGGNTDLLCDEFRRGAEEAGATVEKISLSDYRIDFINAEDVELGMQRKANKDNRDDAPMIIGKMDKADVIVLASPVYFMNITGQLKTLMDRVYSCGYRLSGKQFYFITACTDGSDITAQCTIDAFQGFTVCLPKAEVKDMVTATAASVEPKTGSIAARLSVRLRVVQRIVLADTARTSMLTRTECILSIMELRKEDS